jgi:hypothetical protein
MGQTLQAPMSSAILRAKCPVCHQVVTVVPFGGQIHTWAGNCGHWRLEDGKITFAEAR